MIRESGKEDIILAQEKGYNTYKRVDDSRCKAAQDWWIANNEKWQKVRNKWDDVYKRNTDLTLEAKVDNKPLYKHLFADEVKKEEEVETIIESFVRK